MEMTPQNVQQIVAASNSAPVLLQATATWCEPCKVLSPILEKAVKAHKGNVLLVKLDVDKLPQMAQQLQVTRVPTVLVLFQGQILTSFTGLPPEPEVKRFVNEIVRQITGAAPPPDEGSEDQQNATALLQQAEATLNSGHVQAAAELFTQVYNAFNKRMDERKAAEEAAKKANSPELRSLREEQKADFAIVIRAAAGLVRCAASTGEVEAARSVLDAVSAWANSDLRLKAVAEESKELVSARASLELAGDLKEASNTPIEQLEAAARAGDNAAAHALAVRLFAAGRAEEAVDVCLIVIKRSKGEDRDKARQLTLRFFTLLGNDHPVAQKGRRRLTSALL